MNIIHDNTAMQAIKRCLKSESQDNMENPIDLENLLHFLTSYILGEHIYIPGFVHDKVANERNEAIELLKSIGLQTENVTIMNESEDEFKKRCTRVANNLIEDLSHGNEFQDFYLDIKNFRISKHERSHAEDIHRLIFNPELKKIILDNSFSEHEFGAVGYMLSSSELLYEEVQKSKDNWTLISTQKLIDSLRYKLNYSLDGIANSAYAPNIKRAKSIDGQITIIKNGLKEEIVKLLDSGIINSEKEIILEPIGLPGIARALVYESEGKIEKLIDLANVARVDMLPLRKLISSILQDEKNSSNKNWFILRGELIELINSYSLGKQKILKDGPSLESLGTYPIPSLKTMIEAFNNIRVRKELNIISEFARSIQNPFKDTSSFKKLLKSVINN